ncbi:MAG: hypothetical protein ABI878_06250 [Acidobacteriota bacterium]
MWIPTLLGLVLGVHAAFGQSPQPQTTSAQSSPRSGTDVSRQKAEGSRQSTDLIGACAAAVEDLRATRELAASLETENAALKKQLDTATQSIDLLTELDVTRKSETDALRETVAAKTQAIAAKDSVIESQDKLISALKSKKSSPWKRLGDVLIGVGIAAVLR